ncbi:hypothetical protein [Streptomyces flavofungini]|uniref:Lipoprotein n=1 Tax=Streptomyces flavofungini TaxID=68200 RepID=A0ABS0X0X0_9ACTN|nr:hypothetical protein [Streptomyces flavofungini]MBJ3806798.1 hypothetical protein [Streptomyces flavofungini]GHC60467.1 hypothetical protein GCM10010349_29810 [Streptomyces flavofungini]
MTRTRTRSRSAALATAAAALALLATACGGGDDGDGKKDTGGKENAADKAFKERECLRKHGLKVPEPKSGQDGNGITIGGDLSKEKMQKALKECTGKGPGSAGGGVSQADKDKMVKYAQCMRKNGFNMPDPEFKDGMARAMPAPKGAEMKKMEKAAKACKGIVG